MESVIWGFIGTLVGAGVSIWTVRANNKHSEDRRRADALEARGELKRDFQRESLLSLQDALGRAFELFLQSYEGSDNKLNLEYASAGMNVVRLAFRVIDEKLRNEVLAFMDNTSHAHGEIDVEKKAAMLKPVSDEFGVLTRSVGAAVLKHL